MTSRVALALAGLLLSALTATPALAAERRVPLVSAEDAAGDVAIRDVEGPTDRQRRSSDILDLRVVPRDDDLVRFTFRIARVTTSSQFGQLLKVTFSDAEQGFPEVTGALSLRVQDPRGGRAEATAETENGATGAGCVGYPLVVLKAAGLVKVDIDRTCLPSGLLDIAVRSFTTTPKGERRVIYSRDFLKVPGSHDLGGLVGSEPN